MFLGADVRPLIRQLVPEAELISRPRFSTLTYVEPAKVTRLPPRSAVRPPPGYAAASWCAAAAAARPSCSARSARARNARGWRCARR